MKYEASSKIVCRGVVTANPVFTETRGVSQSLIVVPIYYVLDSVCPKVIQLLTDASGTLRLVIRAPRGFVIRTALDWRGFGSNGSYQLSIHLFNRYYVYDSLVAADAKLYDIIDFEEWGLSLVKPRRFTRYAEAVKTVHLVSSTLTRWLGPSPRSPTVLVLASPSDPGPVPPGTGFSTGSVIYVKLEEGMRFSKLIYIVSHEAAHGWINYGLLYGDRILMDGLASQLALLALHDTDPSIFHLAVSYASEAAETGGYSTWLKMLMGVYVAVNETCGPSLYMRTLHGLFAEALRDGGLYLELPGFVRTIIEEAPPDCRTSLVRQLGPTLVAIAYGSHNWPFVNTSTLLPGCNRVVRERELETLTVVRTTTTTVTCIELVTRVTTITQHATLEGRSETQTRGTHICHYLPLLMPLVSFVTLYAFMKLKNRGS